MADTKNIMIVTKRPLTLYDVDLLGLAGLVVLLVAGWWVIAVPWRSTWQDYRRFVVARKAVGDKLHQEVINLAEFEHGLTQLDQSVTAAAAEVPHSDALPQLLRNLTDAAVDARLELRDVSPHAVGSQSGPGAAPEAYLITDVKLAGRGHSRDFLRFLDRLARENPYQSLESCSVLCAPDVKSDLEPDAARAAPEESASDRAKTGAICDIAWTIRLYFLPVGNAASPPAGKEGAASPPPQPGARG